MRDTEMRVFRRFRCVVAGLILLHFASSAIAESTTDRELAGKLTPLIESHEGDVSVAVRHLSKHVGFDYESNRPMPTASLIKFPLLVAAFEAIENGEASLDDDITLKESDKVPGSGILTPHFSEGARLPFRDLLRLMMVFSDNTATNMVVEHVGLPRTARLMESLGCPETKLHSKTYRRDTSIFPARSQQYGLGSTTAADMVKLLTMLHEGKLVSQDASRQMVELMLDCADDTKIARHLPAGTKVANKSGEVSASRTDAALVDSPSGPIAICVLTTKNKDQQWGDDNAAVVLCAEIGKAVYEHFNAESAAEESAGPKTLAAGSNGRIVEALQRTLNARAHSGLTVDGDFGPATQAAVVAFQESKGLDGTGVVDGVTWEALGSLLMEEAPQPAPDEVNRQVQTREPERPLDGLPYVTAKAWVIGDPESGDVLWNYHGEQRLDPASTTKIMTGYIVTSLATEDPSVLDEIVTFSKRADETPGSTSGVRAGEQLPVRELLYGLLLPSGNDASVALAEHFGGRMGEGDAFQQFIDRMNRTAKEVGMSETTYVNTHGLTAEAHKTTARDLFGLASRAMNLPLFAGYVGTPIRGATVIGREGYTRNLVWKNTNRLLKVEGYDGVKTGTTSAAGSCLVSQGNRHGRRLIVVVLGSAATASRYADSRNLYRYAWQHLEKK